MQIQANDVGRLGYKQRVGADAPAAPPLQVNALTAQHSPHLMRRDVAQGLGHQFAAPAGISRRWWLVELRQNPLSGGFVVTALSSGARRIEQARDSAPDKTTAPLRYGRGSHAFYAGDRPAAPARSGGQDNSPSQRQPLLSPRAPNPTFQHSPILRHQHQGLGFLEHADRIPCYAYFCK